MLTKNPGRPRLLLLPGQDDLATAGPHLHQAERVAHQLHRRLRCQSSRSHLQEQEPAQTRPQSKRVVLRLSSTEINTGTLSALLENLRALVHLDSMSLDFSDNPLPTLSFAVVESFCLGVKCSVHLLFSNCSLSADMVRALGTLLVGKLSDKTTLKIGASG